MRPPNTSTSQRYQAGSRKRKKQAKKGHLPPLNCLGVPDGSHGPHGWVEPIRQTLIHRVDHAKVTLHVCAKCEKEINAEISDGLAEYYADHPSFPYKKGA